MTVGRRGKKMAVIRTNSLCGGEYVKRKGRALHRYKQMRSKREDPRAETKREAQINSK
jgi:hypothetical protein